jgi:hypothetical protein
MEATLGLVFPRSVLFEAGGVAQSVKTTEQVANDQVTNEQVSPFEHFLLRHTSRIGFAAAT